MTNENLIDYLIKNHIIIQYFGLGFIQIKINEHKRFHFYHKDILATTDDIHNHTYDFKSTILRGTLTERLYLISNGNDYYQKISNCKLGSTNSILENKVNANLICEITHLQNDSYHRKTTEYHTVYSDYGVTMLERGNKLNDTAIILIKNLDELHTCPFKNNYTIPQLWEIVNDIWNMK